MRTNLPFIQCRVSAMLAGLGTSVRIHWLEWPPNAARDPVTGSRAGTPTAKTQVVQAFVHFPTAGGENSAVRVFNEVELGDCIVDLPPDVVLEGREGLRFELLDANEEPLVEGETWVPKATGEKLQRCWDVVVAGRRLVRPVLLRKGR